MAETTTSPVQAPQASHAEASLLDQIVDQSKVARSDAEHARARDIISELVREVLQGTVVVSDNLSVTLDARVAELDRLISAQLSEVMHHPQFQKLESSWTGLHYLCRQTSTGAGMKIKLFNAQKKELVKDFRSAIDFDQSALFRKVYEEEFGTFGGAPFGTLIGDFEISRQPEDMYFIEQMSHVAAAAHAPFITAASPELLGLESYQELGKPRDLSKVFDTVDYAKWHSFRESEDSRYVGLTLPRFLGRLPFNPKDGTAVADYVRKRLHKDKIILLGHSWGSLLGVHMVEARPDLFSVYVGTGQIANLEKDSEAAYPLVLAQAHRGRAKEFTRIAERHRLLALMAGPDVVRLLPPLVVGEAEVDEALARLRSCAVDFAGAAVPA